MNLIVLARKPFVGSVVDTTQHGVGGVNIDGARVGSKNNVKGRWPANLVIEHGAECEFLGEKKVKGIPVEKMCVNKGTRGSDEDDKVYQGAWGSVDTPNGFADKDGFEKIEDWDCKENCLVAKIDEQGGIVDKKGGVSRFFFCAKGD